MLIDKDTLPQLKSFDKFHTTFSDFVIESALAALLRPVISKRRLKDAHYAWQDDLSRIAEREPNIDGELDHFKQCGHLAYWLRRAGPVIEFTDLVEEYGEEGGLYPREIEERKLLVNYGTEYLAFDFGYQFCQFYEIARTDRETSPPPPNLNPEYLLTVCNFLKFKQVSPHAMYLIYKTMFLT